MRDSVFTRLPRLAAVLLAAGLLALPPLAALAQDAEAAADTAAPDADVLTRWQAAPDTVFDAAEIAPDALAYQARILVVFGEAEAQPQFRDQLALIGARMEELARRDVIVVADSDPSGGSALRRQLRPRGFSLVLLDKDGTVVFRKPDPWDVREIGRQIDKLPSRLQEIRN